MGVMKMTVIMPSIEKLLIKTPDQKSVISEHGPEEIHELRKLIEGTDNIIQYVFKKIEEDE
tara:strand:+ start:610 stop:792 length:183 start_codon:yes stop_codon:yes gene_type:complete